MPYLFHENLFLEMQRAFSSAVIQSDLFEHSDPEKRDYFLLQFTHQPAIPFDEKNSVNIISKGDASISHYVNTQLAGLAHIEMGFRWSGLLAEIKKIIFIGFCIKIIYVDHKQNSQHRVIEAVCNVLQQSRFVAETQALHQQFPVPTIPKIKRPHHFFKLPMAVDLCPQLLSDVKDYIQTYVTPVLPAYLRQNEVAMNPAYQDISVTRDKLFLHEKKIWLFRSDFIVAVGNKNAYWINFAENGLADAIHASLHRYINWEDRYGHPSLAAEYPGYRCGAFYGGLLAQRQGYLEVFTSSGRYYRNDLSNQDKKILEAYLAYVFQKAYGRQPIIFIDSLGNQDYFECALFYHDQSMPAYCPKRKYDTDEIQRIFDESFMQNFLQPR